MNIEEQIAKELQISVKQVKNTVKLIDDGNTIPFIARYRKEITGSLDDTVLRNLEERLSYLRSLASRKEEVRSAIEGQEKLTQEIINLLEQAQTLAEVEDIYRPYRPKRTTRAMLARKRGLGPLAEGILLGQKLSFNIYQEAKKYLGKEVEDEADAIQGAQDILAEEISDRADLRAKLREFMKRTGRIVSVKSGEGDPVYEQYYEFSQEISKIVPHRILALNRGEKEGCLKVSIQVEDIQAKEILCREYVKGAGECASVVRKACEDAYSRLIFPALEREIRGDLTEAADTQAIKVFGDNLRQLLLQPPVKGCVTLGLDPAYRTGCKIAVVDETGKVLDTTVIYPTPPQNKKEEAKRILKGLIQKHGVQVISIGNGTASRTGKVLDTTVIYPTPPQNKKEEAKRILKGLIQKHGVQVISIGNGTASRESEQFVAELLHELDRPLSYMVVSEAGASVYSASKLAAEEFPEYDVSLRSAVSIARRLQDPLAELVKIDPKAIGVGQYQHDMPKKQLDTALDGVVESCVNSVGVDLDTASFSLLSHVAGINQTVAKNIVAYREENGAFTERKQLLKVPKLGKKAFEQCAGFLRIRNGKNPLDATAVHPESYSAALLLMKTCGYEQQELKAQGIQDLPQRVQAIDLDAFCTQAGIGRQTAEDIIAELTRPGRDPRDELEKPLLRTDVMSIEDLKEGMELKGTVRNVVDFGAFVDIGVHEDGLVHISQICERFIRHPSEVLKVGDIVTVKVLGVDPARKRISLTMKG